MIGKNESGSDMVQRILNGSSSHDEDHFDIDMSKILYSPSNVNSVKVELGYAPGDILIVDDLFIWIFLGIFGIAGVLMNLIIIYGLLRAKCNGSRYYLLQLAFCDIGTLCLAYLELLYMNHQRWTVAPELCPVYLGLESFTSTATVYFVIALNLHAISVYNLTVDTMERRDTIEHIYSEVDADPGDNDNYEIAIDIRERRSLTIDYCQRKRGIPVLLPALFIWFLGASMAIPLFVFGDVLPSEAEPLLCGVMNFDRHSNLMMQIFIGTIRIAVPFIGLHWSMGCVLLKLHFAKDKLEVCGLDEIAVDVMRLAVLLASTLAIFGMQKVYGSLLFEILSKPFMQYKYPLMDRTMGIGFSTLSFVLPAVRPVMYLVMDKRLCMTIFRCCWRRSRSRRRSHSHAIEVRFD